MRRLFEHLDEWGHSVTLALFAIAAVAAALPSIMPTATTIAPMASEFQNVVTELLHWVEWTALGLILVYAPIIFALRRNAGEEISEAIDEPEPESNRITSLFSREPKYRYQTLQIASRDVNFVSVAQGDDWNELLRLNEEGFDRTAFELDHSKMAKRNTEWVQKNDRLFMLVTSTTPGARPEYIGYTAVVPLTDVGANIYFRGLIKDQDLPADLICRPDEPTHALVIFAIALSRKLRGIRSLGRPQLGRLLRALEYHIDVVAAAHAGHPQGIWVWSQTEHKGVAAHLRTRGFTGTEPPTMSAERFEFVRRRIG
jgi:hypothetical protein